MRERIVMINCYLFSFYYSFNECDSLLIPNAFCSLLQSSRKKVLKWVSFIQMVVIPFRLLAMSIFTFLTWYDFFFPYRKGFRCSLFPFR